MHTQPAVNLSLYTIESRSTTQRGFLADAQLRPRPVAFEPQTAWSTPQFQVDTQLK